MSGFSSDQLSAIRAAVAHLADGYALFDSDDHLLVWNEAYESLNTKVRNLLVAGTTFESLTRALVERGQIPEAIGREQQWIEERIRVRRSGGRNVERQVQVSDGRWFLVRERVTPDGGVVGMWYDITERQRREEVLHDSEERLRAIMDNSPLAITLKDAEGRYRLVNRAFEEWHGISGADALGKKAGDLFPKEHIDTIAAIEREVMEAAKTVDLEYEEDFADGLRHQIVATKFPVFDASGNPAGIGTIYTDATKRKRVEEALQLREQQFKDFAKASGDWFWETDSDHRFTWFSDRVEEMTGVPVAFHIGKNRWELAADQDEHEKWHAHLEALQARRSFRDFRYLRKGHDGRLQHMTSAGVPVFDAEDNFMGYRGTGANITAAVEAEAKAASVQKQLMAAIESVSDGFALFDADDRMVFCNNRFKELNPDLAPKLVPGISFEEILRENIAAGGVLDALGDEEAFIRRRMEQHRNPCGPMVQQRQNGRWLELREERTFDGSTFLVSNDITERKLAEKFVHAAKEEAEKANRTKSEFLATMSHELRTPLNAIIGFSEIIKDETLGPVGSTKYREYADDINESGQHLLSLINDILDLSKVESGTDELLEENIDISQIAKAISKLFVGPARKGNVELELDVSDDISLMRADERKVKQIFLNLLSNAIKFTPDGGKVTLKIWSRAESGYVFQVNDTGIGIAFEDIPKALAPFRQIDGGLNRKHEGTGLGLPLTKALVEQHGGTLDLQSQVGVGTTVTVRFPAERIVASLEYSDSLDVEDRAAS